MQKVAGNERADAREERILQKWKEQKIFERSVSERSRSPKFVFYDGPVTANGLPHIGHILGRIIKDFVCRYKTMTGHFVRRKAGWDTHGLPVELGVEKQLGISGKQQIEEYGVAEFNAKCRESVFAYEREWRHMTEKTAFWLDLEHPYMTLRNQYIERVWHILAHIHEQGLLYKGYRVSPYCPSCQTALSSHEVAQGYKDVKDLSVIAKFAAIDSEDIFLAWTTTPWTLPANVALAVNPALTYLRVSYKDEVYVVAKGLVDKLFESEYDIISEHQGSEFIGRKYQPLFDFVRPEVGHTIVSADFVSDTSGTGIVHIAPAHGEDDYKVAREHKLSILQVVDPAGKYTAEILPWAGKFVKDCDVLIIKELAARNLMFAKEKIEHSYPFCWRCDSPLLYYALESWFIATTKIKEQLIANNKQISWYPEHLRDGRFGKFLEEVVDWNISRSRYWGTPLNVWICQECQHQYAPSSSKQLQEAAGLPVTELDLHKPGVDQFKIPCSKCDGQMERTKEVIDCWFDSGAMPFAQYEDEELAREQFPADIICEGIDQTRGWFYSLLAVSTLYTGKVPFKSVISIGHVLDEDGQKMSKSRGNVVDAHSIIASYGADALRWALLANSSPWKSKRFASKIVAEAKSKVVDTLQNIHAFFVMYALLDGYEADKFPFARSEHMLDRWILSRLHTLIADVRELLLTNDFSQPAREIQTFIDELSNWYVRRSRQRFWGGEMSSDKLAAYQTLQQVLTTLCQVMAPFIPFITEEIYTNLTNDESVHLTDYPIADLTLVDQALEEEMVLVRTIVELGHNVRNQVGIKTRQPLSELLVSLPTQSNLLPYEEIIKEELNVKSVLSVQNDAEWIDVRIRLNFRAAGPQYGPVVNEIDKYLQNHAKDVAAEYLQTEQVTVSLASGAEIIVTSEHLLVEKLAKAGFAASTSGNISVVLKTELTPLLLEEGFVREVIRAIQSYRKQLDLPVEQRINLVLDVDESVTKILRNFEELLAENVLLKELQFKSLTEMETVEIDDKSIRMAVLR